jgi:hypothetical protein
MLTRSNPAVVGRRTQVIVTALVLLSLLVFTTVRTAPIYGAPGPESSLSKTHPKQRHFVASVFTPVVLHAVGSPPEQEDGNVLPHVAGEPHRECFFPRYTDLPPPLS